MIKTLSHQFLSKSALLACVALRLCEPLYGAPPPMSSVEPFAKLPLSFEINNGQASSRVKFLSRGASHTILLTENEAVLSIGHETNRGAVRMRLLGANRNVAMSGQNPLPGNANYFIGNNPEKWHTGIPTYERVTQKAIYPGVDLVYYGNQGRVEYDFVVAPFADPHKIALSIDGNPAVNSQGDLVVTTDAGDIRLQKPVAYQVGPEQSRLPVSARYRLTEGSRVSFVLGGYDRTKPLIIDPILAYSTYFGGSGVDGALGMAVDSAGNVYVTGQTTSTDFPTNNPAQPQNNGGADGFITKINAAGTAVVYSTYLGGSNSDQPFGIAVDAAGNAYLGGATFSPDFPTVNPIQSTLKGASDAFLTKLDPTGSRLVYSTFLGGSLSEYGLAIAIDQAGGAYIVGQTTSNDYPTLNPIQPSPETYNWHGFVTKVNVAGSALVYSTYLGGNAIDTAQCVVVDSSMNAYVTGFTESTDFPVVNPIQPTNHGGYDAFLTKINPQGSAFVYSTYLGGGGSEAGTGLAVDSSGNIYLAGNTTSADFPTQNPIQASAGNGDAFVTKINAAGSALVYSTYLGGSGQDLTYYPNALAIDQFGNAYVTGGTNSSDFPTVNPNQAANAGGFDAFITKINAAGSAIVYSSYLGGSADENNYTGASIGLDSTGGVYLFGTTTSNNFPTVKPLQAANMGGSYDLFIAKLSSGATVSSHNLTFPKEIIGHTSPAQTVTLTNISSTALSITSIGTTDAAEFRETNNCGVTLSAGASCDSTITFTPNALGVRSGKLVIYDSELDSPQATALAGVGTAISLSPNPLAFGPHNVGTITAPRTITLTNVGLTLVTITMIRIGGPNATDFSQSSTTCGSTVAAGASCTVGIKFAPSATGLRTAALIVSDNGGGSPQNATLEGTGN